VDFFDDRLLGQQRGDIDMGLADALRILLGGHDRHADLLRDAHQPLDVFQYALPVVDMRQQAFLHVDDEQGGIVGVHQHVAAPWVCPEYSIGLPSHGWHAIYFRIRAPGRARHGHRQRRLELSCYRHSPEPASPGRLCASISESRLTTAAQRDLQTIVDFVAADIEGMAAARPSLKGTALAREAAGAGTLLAQSLQRANNEHFRNVYFFDAAGHVTTADTDDGPAVAPPMIVLQALEDTRLAVAVDHGDVSEPYRDLTGEEAIGAWRWLPGAAVGVVAERPYERFSQPLDWIDGIFAAVLATLVVGTFLVDFRSLGDLLSAFPAVRHRRCGPMSSNA
jgi:hypothetical protein